MTSAELLPAAVPAHTPLDEAAPPHPRWAACRSSPDRYTVGLMFWL
jgi:hypothetical protein